MHMSAIHHNLKNMVYLGQNLDSVLGALLDDKVLPK